MSVHESRASQAPTDLERRRFLSWLTGVISGVIGVLLVVPLVGSFLGPAFTRKEELWPAIGPEDEITPTPKAFKFRYRETDGWRQTVVRRTVYALRDGPKILVLSNICTHLGCGVRWEPGKELYVCPCHNGFFSRTGEVASGPPPAPLERYRYRIRNGIVQVLVG